ncbi:hypothetical protein GGI07_004369, partial [Coemansia sp. Benny D115]
TTEQDKERISLFSPQLRTTLYERLWYYLRLMAISEVMLWTPLCLFFGAVYKQSYFAHHAQIGVVNFSSGHREAMGRDIEQRILAYNAQPPDPTAPAWILWDQSLGSSRRHVREWVRLHGWGALVIDNNDKDGGGNSDGNVLSITAYLSTGRHPKVSLSTIVPAIEAMARRVVLEVNIEALAQMKTALQQSQLTMPLQQPPLVTPAVFAGSIDVAPMTFMVAPIVTLFNFLVGLLCVIAALIQWKLTTFGFFLKCRQRDVWLAGLGLVFVWTLYISMNCALAMAAFEGPQYRENALPFTVGRFFAIWFTSHAVLLATGLWLSNWFLLLTPELMGLASLITVLPNVVSTLTPVEMTSGFYRFFLAIPFANGAMLYRYILSKAYPQLGHNIGVLLGEVVGMCLVLFATTWLRQLFVLGGVSDISGWYHGSIFFDSPVAYYKQKRREERAREQQQQQQQQQQQRIVLPRPSISDSFDETTSLNVGDLGV